MRARDDRRAGPVRQGRPADLRGLRWRLNEGSDRGAGVARHRDATSGASRTGRGGRDETSRRHRPRQDGSADRPEPDGPRLRGDRLPPARLAGARRGRRARRRLAVAEVAERADVLLSIVPDAAAVEDVVSGPDGHASRTLRPGTVHIEMSTIDVARKKAIRDAVQAARRRPAGLPDQRQPGHGRAPAGHHVRLRRAGQRRGRPARAGRDLRPVGVHRRVRHRRAA